MKDLRFCLIFLLLLPSACMLVRGQRYESFTTPTPLERNETLILGFLGGRDKWNDTRAGVRRFALQLREKNLDGVYVETIENRKRDLALQFVRKAFDRNKDGSLDPQERAGARLILYGQSFGGAAVVKFARQLQQLEIPVLLSIQVDSVGRNDDVIPSNVLKAANLLQKDGILIRGEPEIRAQDRSRTKILGNFQYVYTANKISLSGVPWYKKIFRVAHSKMDRDPEVWARVEELILETLRGHTSP